MATVRLAVRSLRERGLLRTVHRTGERSDKHQHLLPEVLDLTPGQVALLGVLLLRGPQTVAELRARTERMHAFTGVEQVEDELAALAGRDEPLARRREREPGRKEVRYAAALVEGAPTRAAPTGAPAAPGAAGAPPDRTPGPPDRAPGPAAADPRPAGRTSEPPPGRSEVDDLRAEVRALGDEVDALRDQVEDLRARLRALGVG